MRWELRQFTPVAAKLTVTGGRFLSMPNLELALCWFSGKQLFSIMGLASIFLGDDLGRRRGVGAAAVHVKPNQWLP